VTTRSADQVLADATARLIEQTDVAGSLALLLADCIEALDADAAGLLVGEPLHELELLSATSHRTSELELYQVLNGTGPCVEAITSARHVTSSVATDLTTRWPPVGQAILDAGFETVHAFPLHWHGSIIGALNIFFRRPVDRDLADHLATAQAIANIATLILLQPAEHDLDALRSRVQDALSGRLVIEQAKGILAYREHLDLGEAYDRLTAIAASRGSGLTVAARQLIEDASRRP
jgi:transcriptional regulator with GAF, ATPase, and Fis domain